MESVLATGKRASHREASPGIMRRRGQVGAAPRQSFNDCARGRGSPKKSCAAVPVDAVVVIYATSEEFNAVVGDKKELEWVQHELGSLPDTGTALPSEIGLSPRYRCGQEIPQAKLRASCVDPWRLKPAIGSG